MEMLNKIKALKENKEIQDLFKRILIIIVLYMLSFVFLLKSPSHIWINSDTSIDSSVFQTVAQVMDKGGLIYKDTFDHKGPLMYFINYIGLKISYSNGIWLIEMINLFITLCFMYKIARLKCNRKISILAVIIAMIPMFNFFEGGNYTEEFAMPLIAASIYIFLNYFLNSKYSKLGWTICGLCLGGTLLLRPNMISTWVIFCLAVFVDFLSKKKFKELIKYILYFLLGLILILVPTLIYLIANGIIGDFWASYITFNAKYTSNSAGTNLGIGAIWQSILFFFNNPITIISAVTVLFIGKIKKDIVYDIYKAYFFLTFLLTCISGMEYGHYGLVIIPMLVFPIAELYNVLNLRKQEEIKYALQLIVTGYLFATIIIPTWGPLLNAIPTVFNSYELRLSETVESIKKIIEENTNEDDEISVYGNWNVIYVVTKKLPATKYSYQFPIGNVDEEIFKQYFSELEDKLPKIIVLQKNRKDNKITEFLNTHNYTLIWDEETKNNNQNNSNNNTNNKITSYAQVYKINE